jgi:hypothetical protein
VFDPAYQEKLFSFGEELGRAGNRWLRRPPELIPDRPRIITAELIPVEPRQSQPTGPSFSIDGTIVEPPLRE